MKKKKCQHKYKMFIGYKPEYCGKHDSEIWKCYSCEKFILVETIVDWKNAKTMKQGDFDIQITPTFPKPKPTLREHLKETDNDFQHHSGV